MKCIKTVLERIFQPGNASKSSPLRDLSLDSLFSPYAFFFFFFSNSREVTRINNYIH